MRLLMSQIRVGEGGNFWKEGVDEGRGSERQETAVGKGAATGGAPIKV